MGELDDSFALLLGKQPSDRERQDLYRARDALKLKPTDSVWLLLMALGHYETLYKEIPGRIESSVRAVTEAARAAAAAEAKAAHAEAKRSLMDAIHEAAVKAADAAAGAAIARWVSIAAGVVCVSLVLLGWMAFDYGEGKGTAVGENTAMKKCGALAALSSWAVTPDGQLAYGLAKAGGLSEVARCSGRGMAPRDGWCVVASDRGKPLARWPLPVDVTRPKGANP